MNRNFYPEITPYQTEMLQVSSLHSLYLEELGNPKGIPVIFLHGGPGSGVTSDSARFFNPEKYRIILYDQRGCGRSTPHSELKDNTTWDLVEDLEKIRLHLKIEKWAVFGGSWGSTLAVAYAETHPNAVLKLFLRGLFLLRKEEIHWLYEEGASFVYPDAFGIYRDFIPEDERGDFVKAYYKRLTHEDSEIRARAALIWSQWEARCSRLIPDINMVEKFSNNEDLADAFARIECHYFINKGFFNESNALLENVHKIRHIPTVVVHGRYDMVCPVKNSWDFKEKFPECQLIIVPDAGHSANEEGIRSALIGELDLFAASPPASLAAQ